MKNSWIPNQLVSASPSSPRSSSHFFAVSLAKLTSVPTNITAIVASPTIPSQSHAIRYALCGGSVGSSPTARAYGGNDSPHP